MAVLNFWRAALRRITKGHFLLPSGTSSQEWNMEKWTQITTERIRGYRIYSFNISETNVYRGPTVYGPVLSAQDGGVNEAGKRLWSHSGKWPLLFREWLGNSSGWCTSVLAPGPCPYLWNCKMKMEVLWRYYGYCQWGYGVLLAADLRLQVASTQFFFMVRLTRCSDTVLSLYIEDFSQKLFHLVKYFFG